MGIPLPVTATVDDRSFKQAGDKAERAMADAGRNAGKSFSDAINGATKDAEGALKKFGDKASDAYDKARDAAGRLRTEEEKLKKLRADSAGDERIVAQVERVEKARRAEARAIRDAKDALRDYYDEESKHSGSAGEALVRGLTEGMSGTRLGAIGRSSGGELASGLMAGTAGVGAMVGAAIGAGIVTAIGAAVAGVWTGIQDGMASLRIKDLMQTRMGIGDDAMHRMGDAAGRAYASGFGESVQDNLKAIQFGLQGGLINPNATADDIAKYTERIQTTSQVMDEDPDAIARGARNLIRTGLVNDYSQALDLLTAASQRGLNVTKDLIDTAEEYGTAWHGVGLSAADAFGLIKQMSDAGIRNTDVAADSIKELSINVADGSKLTKSAFEALGLNADDMTKRFAAGGPVARTALAEVLNGLRNLDDPTQKQLVGLALFKTKWEDAKTAIQNANLENAARELGDVGGATDTATSKLKEHADAWDLVGRNIGQVLTRMEEWLANTAIGRFFGEGLPNFLNDLMAPPPAAPPPGAPGQTLGDSGLLTGGGPPVQGPGIPQIPSNSGGLPPLLQGGGPVVGPVTVDPRIKAPIPGQVTTPERPPDPGVPGGPIPHQAPVPMKPEADQGPPAKFNADPSKWSLDSVPLGSFPGEEGLSAPPATTAAGPAPTPGAPPQIMWGTGADPYGKPGYGYYQVDQGRVYDAQTSQMSAQASLQNARFHFLEVQAKADATEQEKYNARVQLVQAGRQLQSAEMKLAEAQQGTWKKLENSAKAFGSGMDQIGAALDNDLGISKGLPGLAENLTKFIANLAAAPLLGQLQAIAAVNPSKGGYGLMGILGAQGVFGSRFTGIDPQLAYGYAASAGLGGPLAAYGRPGFAAQPGESARDFAHRAMMPFWQSMGFTVGDHAADKYGEHQNGALDVMVNSIAEGNKVLQQVLSDPNVYGAIFNNQTFGYGHGRNPQDYSAGHTGNPTQDHQDHVHVFYKPGGANNITPSSGGAPGLSPQQWNNIAQAEASGNWATNTGNGYSGGLQFDPNTWNAFGGPQYAPQAWQATPEQQMAVGNNVLAAQGPAAWPATSAAHPEWFTPQSLPINFGGGGGIPGRGGAPQAAPFALNSPIGGIAFPSQPGGGGFQGVSGAPMDAAMMAAGGLDLLAPGAGQAAQMGMKLANRAIGYAGQLAGIGVSGLMETFLPSGSPLGNIGNSWFGRLASGFAGARPALPNVAGQQAPPNPNAQQQGQQQGGKGDTNIELNYTNNGATEDRAGADLTRHLETTNAPAGVR